MEEVTGIVVPDIGTPVAAMPVETILLPAENVIAQPVVAGELGEPAELLLGVVSTSAILSAETTETTPSSTNKPKRTLPDGGYPQPRGRPRLNHHWSTGAGEWIRDDDADALAPEAAAEQKTERRDQRRQKHSFDLESARNTLLAHGVDSLKGCEAKALLREAEQPLGGGKEALVQRWKEYVATHPVPQQPMQVDALTSGVPSVAASVVGVSDDGTQLAGATTAVATLHADCADSLAVPPPLEPLAPLEVDATVV